MMKVTADVAAGKKPADIQKELTDMVKLYQVDPAQVKAEQANERTNKTPMAPAPPVGQPADRVPMDKLYEQHSDNAVPEVRNMAQQGTLDGPGKQKTVDGGLAAVAGKRLSSTVGITAGSPASRYVEGCSIRHVEVGAGSRYPWPTISYCFCVS